MLTAENGKEGVQKARTLHPDLIICDIMMPEMDGYETLYLLSKNEETRNIPFIFLSAKAEKGDARKGMNLGADDYLTKPFEEMELLHAIETRLKRSEELKKEFTGGIQDFERFADRAPSLEGLKSLTKNKTGKLYRKREVLFHEGDYAGCVFYIEKGRIRSFKTNTEGKEFTTALFGAGDFIGHVALIQEIEHPYSAMATEDTIVYRIGKDDFNALLHNNREVALAFIRLLSGSVLEKQESLLNLAYNSVRKRVANGLLALQEKYNEQKPDIFSIAIPREELASIVGTSPESVIRVLSDFKQENLIEVKGSNITRIDPVKLSKLH